MIKERPVLSATTEIVVAALTSKGTYPSEAYANDVAAFAETIYNKLAELEYGKKE